MTARRETLLMVDFSYQVYRATCANPNLSSDGVFTGGLFGFFMWLGKAVRETEATLLAICMDRPPYLRSRVYPPYKQFRKSQQDPETKERYEVSKRQVLDVLRALNVHLYACDGYEADDIGAGIALRYRHRMERIYWGTNDSDAYQLLWIDNLALYRTNIKELVTRRTMEEVLGITPEQHMLMTALQGTHNDIEGIPGIGMRRSLAAVKDPAKLRVLRDKWGDVIDRNMCLIRLPYAHLPSSATHLLSSHSDFNPRMLYHALAPYDIDVSEWMVKAFDQTAV
jgi:DNA polymerase-1